MKALRCAGAAFLRSLGPQSPRVMCRALCSTSVTANKPASVEVKTLDDISCFSTVSVSELIDALHAKKRSDRAKSGASADERLEAQETTRTVVQALAGAFHFLYGNTLATLVSQYELLSPNADFQETEDLTAQELLEVQEQFVEGVMQRLIEANFVLATRDDQNYCTMFENPESLPMTVSWESLQRFLHPERLYAVPSGVPVSAVAPKWSEGLLLAHRGWSLQHSSGRFVVEKTEKMIEKASKFVTNLLLGRTKRVLNSVFVAPFKAIRSLFGGRADTDDDKADYLQWQHTLDQHDPQAAELRRCRDQARPDLAEPEDSKLGNLLCKEQLHLPRYDNVFVMYRHDEPGRRQWDNDHLRICLNMSRRVEMADLDKQVPHITEVYLAPSSAVSFAASASLAGVALATSLMMPEGLADTLSDHATTAVNVAAVSCCANALRLAYRYNLHRNFGKQTMENRVHCKSIAKNEGALLSLVYEAHHEQMKRALLTYYALLDEGGWVPREDLPLLTQNAAATLMGQPSIRLGTRHPTNNDRGTGLATLMQWGLVLEHDGNYSAIEEADALELLLKRQQDVFDSPSLR